MKLILLTGLSGAGKSVALNTLEDAGFVCIDNLPVATLLVTVQHLQTEGRSKIAVAVDARAGQSAAAIVALLPRLKTLADVKLLFLSANPATLIARYSESRRPHPLALYETEAERSLADCIALEQLWLEPLLAVSEVLDTSGLSVSNLRHAVKQLAQTVGLGLSLRFESFGFKYVLPQDADFVFDVRCLPNPYYDLQLRPLTGLDEPVAAYLRAQSATAELIDDISQFLLQWLPRYAVDGRSRVTVAIGCTGGQHRSVFVTEELVKRFSQQYRVTVTHRQQNRV